MELLNKEQTKNALNNICLALRIQNLPTEAKKPGFDLSEWVDMTMRVSNKTEEEVLQSAYEEMEKGK